jgi:hypothetical protein
MLKLTASFLQEPFRYYLHRTAPCIFGLQPYISIVTKFVENGSFELKVDQSFNLKEFGCNYEVKFGAVIHGMLVCVLQTDSDVSNLAIFDLNQDTGHLSRFGILATLRFLGTL